MKMMVTFPWRVEMSPAARRRRACVRHASLWRIHRLSVRARRVASTAGIWRTWGRGGTEHAGLVAESCAVRWWQPVLNADEIRGSSLAG